MTIFYPDVSSFQAGVSFSGAPIAMVKATEGTDYTNTDYSPAKIRAKDAGAFFCAYHFLREGNGAAQADHAFSVSRLDAADAGRRDRNPKRCHF